MADADLVTRGTARIARLPGYRRVWNVAMDNSHSAPGYKYYVDPETTERPQLFVTYLNVEPAAGDECVGVLLPVTDEELEQLDRRELNYTRIEVGDAWVYVGSAGGRERYERGVELGTAVIQREYHEHVEAGFRTHGLLEEFRAGTLAPQVPLRSLRRIDTPE